MKESVYILWVDFLANGERLADPLEQQKLVHNAINAGITHLVIDAKIPFGQVTYKSNFGPPVSGWSDEKYEMWKERDFLEEILSKTKDIDIKVLANVNVFSEGTTSSYDGIAYEKENWKVKFYNDAVSSESNAAEYPDADTIFVNPIHPEVIEHELNIIREVCAYEGLHGIVLDRCRYPNVYGDFSDISQKSFEVYIGEKIVNWPEDIFTINSETKSIQFGHYFSKWTEWRANNIKSFIREARRTVKSNDPQLLFCDYVGSWYPLYFSEGVNWGSETYKPNLEWTSDTYHVSGLAEELDFIMTGCYYSEVHIEEAIQNGRPAEWYSVEGAIDKSLEVINGSIPVVGSLFLKDYINNPDQFKKAIRMCLEKSNGVMLFDAVYVEDYKWWPILENVLGQEESQQYEKLVKRELHD